MYRGLFCVIVFLLLSTTILLASPETSEHGQWVAVPIEQEGPNLWVSVDLMSDYLNYWPCAASCWNIRVYLDVSPCPVQAARVQNGERVDIWTPDCAQGTAHLEAAPVTPDPSLQLLLAPGEYEISGIWWTIYFGPEMGGACAEEKCQFTGRPDPAMFNTATLPTRETTWGRIKALYRQ